MAEGKVVYEITGDNSGFQKSVNETEQIASGGFDKVKLKAAAAWAAVAVAAKKAVEAVVDVVKQSVAQYAEFEQLSSGAELLFGEGYEFIAQKAQDAYKNVGLSQNEYLQQVNGFSVGLREALGGNEQAAAELADKIVTAEADVVAATGNTQEAVQNAFNGIMKGNYTMLDNLQLGITPTKEGMQEVIDKVNEWNAAQGKASNYTIDNLADVQSALVDYIEMQGMAGYAADEAAKTIQGSANMAKAAWKNLLTGLGDPNADIEALVNNLIDSAGALANNLIPVIGRIFEALWEALKILVGKLIDAAGEWLSELGEAIKEKAGEIWDTITAFFEEKLSAIADFFTNIWQSILDFFTGILDSIKQVFVDIWNGLSEENQQWLIGIWENIQERWNTICEFFSTIWEAIKSVFTTAGEGISSFISSTWDTIKSVSETVWNAIKQFFINTWDNLKQNFQSVLDVMKTLFNTFKDNIMAIWEGIKAVFDGIITFLRGVFTGNWQAAWEGIKQVFTAIWDTIKSVLRNSVSAFLQIGRDLMEGLKQGIKEKVSAIIESVKGAVSDAIAAAKNLLGIASPSKVFKQMGVFVDEGFAQGIIGNAQKAISAAVSMASGAINGALNGLSAAYNTSYATTNNSSIFSVGKISDAITIRSEADIDLLLEKMYQRFMVDKRGRGLF